ncbi:hypothetical protein GCM10022278_03960 [Allohahella marinimesophila]|uniref:Uncharacterized protein n=1 Tax=Allohahella marinimesophila TaxID=1054972 RepID=A0ABP7NIM8_9GAMM
MGVIQAIDIKAVYQLYRQSMLKRQSSHYQSVAAIVTATDNDTETLAIRPTLAKQAEGGPRCHLHQGEVTMLLAQPGIDVAQLRDSVHW